MSILGGQFEGGYGSSHSLRLPQIICASKQCVQYGEESQLFTNNPQEKKQVDSDE